MRAQARPSRRHEVIALSDICFAPGAQLAAAVEPAARHIALRNLRRNFPDIEGVARVTGIVLAAAASNPVCQAQDLEIGLLPGKEVDLSGRIEVTEIIVGADEVLPGRYIAIGGPADQRYPDNRLVHPNIRGAHAIVGPWVAIEPGPRLARRD